MHTSKEILAFADSIGIQPEMRAQLAACLPEIPFVKLRLLIDGLRDRDKMVKAYPELKQELRPDHGQIKMLACYLYAGIDEHEVYRSLGIGDDIFYATVGCFRRFIGETHARYGKWEFDRGWWTFLQASLTLFRIGELEYECSTYDGAPAVSIHIPSDADMREERVSQSIRDAEAFFGRLYPEYKDAVWFCDSWLLGPDLLPFLREGSHIRSFQERFTIVKTNPEATGWLEWLFRVPKGTPIEDLPENTSLQRNVKAAVLAGQHVGSGEGILVRRE